MKKLIIFALCIVVGGSLLAQSKSDLKDQLDAVNTELQLLKRADSLNNLQYQATIRLLEDKIANMNATIDMQNKALNNYATQVDRLNNEVNNLSSRVANTANNSPREIIIFFNNANNTFHVPTGKIWKIENTFYPSGNSLYSTPSLNKDSDDPNFRFIKCYVTKIGPKAVFEQLDYGVFTENTEFKLEIWFMKFKRDDEYSRHTVKDHVAPVDFQCYLRILEYDNE